MILFIFCCALSFWLEYEFKQFSVKINKQIYQDISEVYPLSISFNEFTAQSRLQAQSIKHRGLFLIFFPLISLLLSDYPLEIILIGILLCYLSFLDYTYYLTDIRYLSLIFLCALSYLIFQPETDIRTHFFTLFITSLFFGKLHLIFQYIVKKELLGSGDSLLFIALTPLFTPEQMILLILFSSLSGLCFALIYFCKFRRKIDRLPFIPFITFSTLWLILAKLPTS